MRLPLLLAVLFLAGCGDVSRQLSNSKTGESARCSTFVVGDPLLPLPADHQYCVCMADHLAGGFVPVGEPKLLNMCRGLPN